MIEKTISYGYGFQTAVFPPKWPKIPHRKLRTTIRRNPRYNKRLPPPDYNHIDYEQWIQIYG